MKGKQELEERGMDGKKTESVSSFPVRTDLALENRESFEGDGGEVSGVALREWVHKKSRVKLTEVKILNSQGAQAMGKPMGTYLTLEANQLLKEDEEYHSQIAGELAGELRRLMEEMLGGRGCFRKTGGPGGGQNGEKKKGKKKKGFPAILVAGLGNSSVTPDSLGPRVVGNLRMTRHLREFGQREEAAQISGIAPGVMAQTGMETAEILKGIIRETKPDLVIAIDALAARSVRRLGTTIQLTDTGIQPGSGVGNHRHSLTEESLGVPVLAIGVPTVVGAAAIVQDTLSALIQVLRNSRITKKTGDWIAGMEPEDQYQLIRELLEPEFGPLYVTPPDIDQSVKRLSFTISEGIHQAVFEEKGRE
ncbi:MAG TPA: GPR endopeptidase [Candidatus Scatomonas merdigallinarum]|nr:GPR endopeptidase [Candidatus Scatomonas merdigallinarum]